MSADVFAYISAGMAGTLLLLAVYLTYKLITVYDEGNHLRDLLDDGIKREAMLTADRDALSVKVTVAQDAATKALDRLSIAESQRNNAQRDVVTKVAEEIRHAPTTAHRAPCRTCPRRSRWWGFLISTRRDATGCT